VLPERRVHSGCALLGPVGEWQRVRVRLLELRAGRDGPLSRQLHGPPGSYFLNQVLSEPEERVVGTHPPSPFPRVFWPTALPPDAPPGRPAPEPPLPGGMNPRGGNAGGGAFWPWPAFWPAPGGT
jgi:hypothetical protein